MSAEMIGACLYTISSSCVIWYEMIINHKEADWLKIYLPLSVLVFIFLAAFKFKK